MNVIILAGGRGTRLPISARDIPKPLVEVHGKPMLEHQLERLATFGETSIRLALGFRAEAIASFLKSRGYPYEYVVEPAALGTGGAVRFAMGDAPGPFLILNGDVAADFDYEKILAGYERGHGLIVSYWKEDARDFGLLRIEDDRIREFLEKPTTLQSGYINAGCYILHRQDLDDMPEGHFMLERDVFPGLAVRGRLKTVIHKGFFEDLGTEERLAQVRSGPRLW